MESNLNQQSIRKYAGAFAEELAVKAFAAAEHLGGSDLLNMAGLKQINLLVLKSLQDKWQEESARLRSPYFDYEAAEVKTALSEFMNLLSRHIRVSREALLPVLAEAVEKTLLLIFSPYEFYVRELRRFPSGQVGLEQLKTLLRYVKVNQNLLQSLIARFESKGIEAVFLEDALRMFDDVCEATGESPADFEPYLTAFSAVLPLDLSVLYSESATAEPEADSATSASGSERPQMQNPNAGDERKALHETLGPEKRKTLADIHLKINLDEGLLKAFNLNQRVMFVRELFGGSHEEYERSVAFLDTCGNRQEAFEFLRINYFDKGTWDPEKEEVAEFLEILEQRFPG